MVKKMGKEARHEIVHAKRSQDYVLKKRMKSNMVKY